MGGPHRTKPTRAGRTNAMGVIRDRTVAALPLRLRWWLAQRGEYELAVRYLGGLSGVEIGGGAHNRFPVDAINIDRFGEMDTEYKDEERRLARRALAVDIVAPGDDLPLEDKSVDFVLASHVIEHFPDPVKALLEWERVASRYILLVVPHRDRTFDSDRELTPVDELIERHASGFSSDEDRHWSVWSCESFVELCQRIGLSVIETEDPDKKVGNGFAVVIAASAGSSLSAEK
ncbi:MAG: class I SAM-dependent methyltransferase [Solirubrobacteraceae bacterium]|nr:class I SAM-dependent methyltransferase [Solirubrobacteraceae bacterium]